MTKRKKEGRFRKESGDITTYAIEMQETVRDYEQLYTITGQSEKKGITSSETYKLSWLN